MFSRSGQYSARVEICSEDCFQGIEKDVIIVTTLKPYDGFRLLDCRDRLAITLTRAKSSLVFFGNFQYVQMKIDSMSSTWQSFFVDAKRRQRYIDLDGEFNEHKIMKNISV